MSSISIQLREQFTATGGSSFSGGKVVDIPNLDALQDILWAAASDITGVLHYTTSVGTSYEKVVDPVGGGTEDFGEVGQAGFYLFINRSTTQDCTIRLSAATDPAYFTLPPGKWIFFPYIALWETNDTTNETLTDVSAKFASSSDTLELLACSINTDFS